MSIQVKPGIGPGPVIPKKDESLLEDLTHITGCIAFGALIPWTFAKAPCATPLACCCFCHHAEKVGDIFAKTLGREPTPALSVYSMF